MNFRWRESSPPPKMLRGGKEVAIPVEDVASLLREMPEPNPEALLADSKKREHLLHYELWHEPDSTWAGRARIQRCRQIIASVHQTINIGAKTVTVRHIEFVRTPEGSKWAHIEDILKDPQLDKAYLREIQRLQEQATAKLVKYQQLRWGSSSKE